MLCRELGCNSYLSTVGFVQRAFFCVVFISRASGIRTIYKVPTLWNLLNRKLRGHIEAFVRKTWFSVQFQCCNKASYDNPYNSTLGAPKLVNAGIYVECTTNENIHGTISKCEEEV